MKAIQPKWETWLLVFAVMAAIGGTGVVTVQAQPGPESYGPFATPEGLLTPGGFLTKDDREAGARVMRGRVKEKLGLSDQQAEEIRAALKSMRDDARGDMRELRVARRELRQLLARQDSDPAAVRAVADRVKALQGALLDRRLEAQLAIRSKLTPDQWARWLELRTARGHRWMGRGRPMGF